MFGNLQIFMCFLIPLACTQKAVVNKRDVGNCNASAGVCPQDVNFSILDATAEADGSYAIAWQDVAGVSAFDLVITRDKHCEDEFVRFADITSNSQKVKITDDGRAYYICLYAKLNDLRISALNNGLSLSIASAKGSTSAASVEPTPTNQFAPVLNSAIPSNLTDWSGTGIAADPYSFNINEGSITGELNLVAFDDDGDNLTLSCISLPGWAALDQSQKKLSFVPGYSDSTFNHAFQCKVSDGTLDSGLLYFSATVNNVNTAPTISFVQPIANDDAVVVGNSFSISWIDSDPEDDAVITLYYNRAKSGACNSGTLITTASEDNVVNTYSWNATGLLGGVYYICARISDGALSQEVYSDKIIVGESNVCTWTGFTNTAYTTASNWLGCADNSPMSTDMILIPGGLTNQPLLATDHTISGIARGYGGGALTIGVATTLNLASGSLIRSDIEFKGAVTTCSNCFMDQQTSAVSVTDGATVTLGRGFTWGADNGSTINFGSSSTVGHLKTSAAGAAENEKPRFVLRSELRFDAPNGSKSSVDIDGLRIYPKWSEIGNPHSLVFNSNYQIKNFDNVTMGGQSEGFAYGDFYAPYSNIYLKNCETALFDDSTWSNIAFNSRYSNNTYNIDASMCTLVTPITISGDITSRGYGEGLENDPNNVINWINGVSFACIWTGLTSIAWTDATNWGACANGRGGVPTGNDSVVIPSTPINQPLISEGHTFIKEFSTAGAGGGTITLSADNFLYVSHGNFSSSVNFLATTPSCTTCRVYSFHDTTTTINTGAKLHLGLGIRFIITKNSTVLVGDGTTHGIFDASSYSATESEWATLSSNVDWSNGGVSGIKLKGTASNRSRINVDGLKINIAKPSTNTFEFDSYFQIDGFDHITVDANGTDAKTAPYFKVTTCNNSVVNDLTWSGISLIDAMASGNNVDVRGCSALNATPILISPGTQVNDGFGPTYEYDPDEVVDW